MVELNGYPTNMLEDIDAVRWENLNHAYGRASNIPERLRTIASSRGAALESAIDDFGNDICHQGSAYSATAPCVPFICQIIGNQRVSQRHRLVSLLLTIAIGLDDDMLQDDTRITDYQAQRQQEADDWPANKSRPTSWGPFVWLECYSAVEHAVPQLAVQLHDKDHLVRLHTEYLLAWFPRHRQRMLPLLRNSMKTARRWEDLANSVLAVGLLEWQSRVTRTSRPFVRPLLSHRREEVRFAAAIYSSWHEPTKRAQNILRELCMRDDYDQNAPLPFNGYGWAGFARQQLARVWGDADEAG